MASQSAMTLSTSTARIARSSRRIQKCRHLPLQSTRQVQISSPAAATPSSSSISSPDPLTNNFEDPDATFEVIGSPFSLLSAKLSPSQTLYTRRGTLIGCSGKVENTVSTLSLHSPIANSLRGIPFLFQKITSASPITLLLSSKTTSSSMAVISLDGTTDWQLVPRSALLAWTGSTISVSPSHISGLSVSSIGSTRVTGQGLLAVHGKGQIYQLTLSHGESYIAHPSNIVGYTLSRTAPSAYRFKSSVLRTTIPDLSSWLPATKFTNTMRTTSTYRFFASAIYTLRTWMRRSIFGDRLFLQFTGPGTILLQSRGARVSDVLSERDVNEIAEAEPGVRRVLSGETKAAVSRSVLSSSGSTDREGESGLQSAARTGHVSRGGSATPFDKATSAGSVNPAPVRMSYATVSPGGDVRFEKK